MKRVLVNIENELKKVLPETLKKDLQDDERICTTCNGLGVIAVHRPYGITGDMNPEVKGKRFPYDHQSLASCPDCFNGVQRLCNYCGNPIKKGYIDKCDCAKYKSKQETIKFNKRLETIKNAQEVQEENVTTMLYCEETDKYYRELADLLDEWECDHDDDEELPERLWVTKEVKLSLDASNILENACGDLHEDAYDNCNVNELQKLLDKYAEKQTNTNTYFPCFKQYVIVRRN